jgi:predicted acyltransferase
VDEAVLDKYTIDAEGKRQIIYKHSYSGYPDNEGIVSTLPAIATTLIGVLVGWWLRSGRAAADKCLALLATGVLVSIAGVLLDWWLMPVNKNLWTPSFAVLTAGLAMLTLGTIYWIVDLHGWKRWAFFFAIFGMNSIAAFVFQSWVPRFAGMIDVQGRTLSEYVRTQLANGASSAAQWLPAIDSSHNLSLAYAIVFVLTVWVLLGVMYVCRVFVKA